MANKILKPPCEERPDMAARMKRILWMAPLLGLALSAPASASGKYEIAAGVGTFSGRNFDYFGVDYRGTSPTEMGTTLSPSPIRSLVIQGAYTWGQPGQDPWTTYAVLMPRKEFAIAEENSILSGSMRGHYTFVGIGQKYEWVKGVRFGITGDLRYEHSDIQGAGTSVSLVRPWIGASVACDLPVQARFTPFLALTLSTPILRPPEPDQHAAYRTNGSDSDFARDTLKYLMPRLAVCLEGGLRF